MTETEHWLAEIFRPVLHVFVCVICGALIHRDYRKMHAAFHGRRQK